jgi:hypothetical protein
LVLDVDAMTQAKTQSYVLHVGRADGAGGFATPAWTEVVRWCGSRATELLVYFDRVSELVPRRLAAIGLHASDEVFPDPDARLRGLRFSGTSERQILALETLLFDPESGVTHLMVLAGPRDLASLETDDGDNFLLLELESSEVAELIAQLTPLEENVRTCAAWASSIDGMFEPGHAWKALGAVAA